jgi:hypothetical protein
VRGKSVLDRSSLGEPLAGVCILLKLEHWPLWLQVVVMVPHAALAPVLLWLWWPKSGREWFGFLACIAYLKLFYFVGIR